MVTTPTTPLVSDQLLYQAAAQVQQALLEYRGIEYHVDDLKEVVNNWLESCVQELCEGAAELCVSGDRNAASFNREAFERELNEQPALYCIRI